MNNDNENTKQAMRTTPGKGKHQTGNGKLHTQTKKIIVIIIIIITIIIIIVVVVVILVIIIIINMQEKTIMTIMIIRTIIRMIIRMMIISTLMINMNIPIVFLGNHHLKSLGSERGIVNPPFKTTGKFT